MPGTSGIVASGHPDTSDAARQVLAEGGNAFDAALAALCASTVAEPLLSSLGGGGFLMARPAGGEPQVFDFFVNTPLQKRPEAELDFHPILADFGTAAQAFHIGLGAMAVPGVPAGIETVSRALGRLPLAAIVAPAARLAREGVVVNEQQHRVSRILTPMLEKTPAAMALLAEHDGATRPAAVGSVCRNPALADTLEAFATEGAALFYQGDMARQLAEDCAAMGGQLKAEDLAAYRVEHRQPIAVDALGARAWLNPPPSPGGALVACSLKALESTGLADSAWGSRDHASALVRAMDVANRQRAKEPALFSRGTTHLGVADAEGNLAALTVSNGEGCGYVLPGSGVLMNNMLGEEDLNPGGFHRWPTGVRLASMMCPTIARLPGGTEIALGSGGANRIRGAVLHVLVNTTVFGMPLAQAVAAPRMHLEDRLLGLEACPGGGQAWSADAINALAADWPGLESWPEPNLFFGGVHAVTRGPDGRFDAVGDPRRGGAVSTNVD